MGRRFGVYAACEMEQRRSQRIGEGDEDYHGQSVPARCVPGVDYRVTAAVASPLFRRFAAWSDLSDTAWSVSWGSNASWGLAAT